jgi:hypothetical protein
LSPFPEKPVKCKSRNGRIERSGFACSTSNLGPQGCQLWIPQDPANNYAANNITRRGTEPAAPQRKVSEEVMRGVRHVALLLCGLIPTLAQAEELSRLELNAVETDNNRCLLTFLIENKTSKAIDSLKLDLALFNPEGIIQRRMITEMGPIRGMRTNVRTFPAEGECGQIGAILVNDVTACSVGDPGECMDGLALSSRVKTIRLYK